MNRYRQIMWGNVPVPYVAAWTGEEQFFIGTDPHFNRAAICQKEARGQGKPKFGTPHSDRQRELLAKGLCDLCCKSLKNSTKVSLSHAQPQPHGAEGWAILQLEPMVHKHCAIICIEHCPSLKRDIEHGTLKVRQVTRHRIQCATMDEIYTEQMTGKAIVALGHAKVELIQWIDRDLQWLSSGAMQ